MSFRHLDREDAKGEKKLEIGTPFSSVVPFLDLVAVHQSRLTQVHQSDPMATNSRRREGLQLAQ